MTKDIHSIVKDVYKSTRIVIDIINKVEPRTNSPLAKLRDDLQIAIDEYDRAVDANHN